MSGSGVGGTAAGATTAGATTAAATTAGTTTAGATSAAASGARTTTAADRDSALVADIKAGSLDDGPGIRSVVFFKGCPLRCSWCQNPELVHPWPELQRDASHCTACRRCTAVCPEHVARPAREEQPPGCAACGSCADACPTAARRIVGRWTEPEALVGRLLADAPFYRRSGGGVTLSGGEPALRPRVAGRIAARLREHGIEVLVETCGHFGWAAFARELLPQVSTVYFDLKLVDPVSHRAHTGRSNELIIANFRRVVDARSAAVLPRVPLVPGVTDTPENLRGIAALVRSAGLQRVALLPYNPLWVDKCRAVGVPVRYERREAMPAAEVEQAREVVRDAGVEVVGASGR